ncbi:MAG: sigma-70 family RNA polymerase sigma factor [Candidatus Uhrbacteria bacterium]
MESPERGIVLLTDAAGRIVYVSRSVEDWSGFTVAEAFGSKPGELWGGNMDKSFYASLWNTVAVEQKPFSSRLANKTKTGEILPSLLAVLPIVESGAAKYFLAMQPEQEAWSAFEAEFAVQWKHLVRDPRSLSLWLERWIGTGIEALPGESVVAAIERALIRPMSERFTDRSLDHVAVRSAQENLNEYASIFERYYSTIVGYLRRRLSNVADAEDIAQDVFIKAMNGLSRYRVRNASYKTYLLRIAHNELLNRYRRAATENDWSERQFPARGDSFIHTLENRDSLERALEVLTETDRQILRAFYTEGYSVTGIANRFSKTENAVKLVLSRARKRLRGEL